MEFMKWRVIFEEKNVVGYKSGTNGDVWFVKTGKNKTVDYNAKGVNHISFRVDKMTDVDKVKSHLEKDGVKMLFGTPCHRPEFSASEKETYYQIMFESPDKILFEVVYIGKKNYKIV